MLSLEHREGIEFVKKQMQAEMSRNVERRKERVFEKS